MTLKVSRYRREYLKKKEKKRQENRKRAAAADRLRLFKNANRALKRGPISGIDHLSLQRQVELLQDYVRQLDADIAEFNRLYPDRGGRSAAVTFQRERGRALNEIARLKIGINKGDTPVGDAKW